VPLVEGRCLRAHVEYDARMNPEAELAAFVDDFLARGGELHPFIGIVAQGLSQVGEALSQAQEKSGNWGGMLGNLRSGAGLIQGAAERLRGEAGLERFVAFADTYARFAEAMIDEILRLQADESTHVR
jgi:hypothetical protein